MPPSWYGAQAWRDDAGEYVAAGDLAGRTVTCMLGGAGSNPGNIWNNATSPANVAVFAANVTSVLQSLGFDAVDLDWGDGVDFAGLVRLALQLRTDWPDAVITIPTAFTGEDADDLAPAASAVDAFMAMTYIAIPQWGGWTLPSPLTPLFTVGANKNSVDWVRQAWGSAGVSPTKLVMSVGGFGLARISHHVASREGRDVCQGGDSQGRDAEAYSCSTSQAARPEKRRHGWQIGPRSSEVVRYVG